MTISIIAYESTFKYRTCRNLRVPHAKNMWRWKIIPTGPAECRYYHRSRQSIAYMAYRLKSHQRHTESRGTNLGWKGWTYHRTEATEVTTLSPLRTSPLNLMKREKIHSQTKQGWKTPSKESSSNERNQLPPPRLRPSSPNGGAPVR